MMITQEMLKNATVGQTISGVILIKDCSVLTARNGSKYLVGKVQSGITMSYKVWSNDSAYKSMTTENYENCPAFICADVDDYGGTNSLIIRSIQAVEGYTPEQFFEVVYDAEAYWTALKQRVKEYGSEKAFNILSKILFDNEEVANRFKDEFAAKNHHDNCRSGLLAHTYKVLTNVIHLAGIYGSMIPDKDFLDLLIVGAVLHDIGKIKEMQYGVYQPASIVTHRYLGMEMIGVFKDDIIKSYNEDWYYYLTSIILQHHGEFAEPCGTLASYIIHRADELDSSFTLLCQRITEVGDSVEKVVKMDDRFLHS